MTTAPTGLLLLALLVALAAPTSAMPRVAATAAAPAVTATYTISGSATGGWGFNASSITEPGPTITAAVGENVTLRLYSADRATHSWFLALDGGSAPVAGEPSSADFNSSTTPLVYSFAVPDRVGTFTYKCRVHPTQMTGVFVIVAAPAYVLYGSASQGWGLAPTSVTNPGPNLTATQGVPIEIAFYSEDNTTHAFFVSYDGGQAPTAGEPVSPDFNSSVVPVFLGFTPSVAGNYTYYCRFHPSTMKGTIAIAPAGGAAPPSYTEYAVAVVLVAVVAIAATVVIRRTPRSPPLQPPAAPPGGP